MYVHIHTQTKTHKQTHTHTHTHTHTQGGVGLYTLGMLDATIQRIPQDVLTGPLEAALMSLAAMQYGVLIPSTLIF